MADGILIPPWLKGVDPGELARLHATGMEIGQRAAAQQNAALMAMREAQAREAEASARQAEAQQRIDLEVQRQQAQVQQAAQEIAVKQAAEERQARKAAMQFAGQKQYQDIFNREIQAGSTPEEASRKAFLSSASSFLGQPGGLGTLGDITKSTAPAFAPTVQEMTDPVSGEKFSVVMTGPHAGQVYKSQSEALGKVEATHVVAPQIKNKYAQIEIERQNQIGLKKGDRAFDEAQSRIDQLTKEAEQGRKEFRELMKPSPMKTPEELNPQSQASRPKRRAELANQLSKAHPDWTREQIMAEVRKQIP